MSTPLFHWSPTSRRNQILRRGLVPGSRSVDGLWKPPYVCFADSPSLAWSLSGMTSRGSAIKFWDLWQMWSDVPIGLEELPFDEPPHRVKEYRVYERVYKRDLWYVATRVS